MKSWACFLPHLLPRASILFNIARICNSQFKCNYMKNENVSLNFLFHFWNINQLLKILKKRWSSLQMYFRSYRLWKSLLDHSQKSVVSENALRFNMWKRPKYWRNLLESACMIWKMSPLVSSEILGVFVNTLTAEGKYPVQDWVNLPLLIQMQLSDNWKIFSEFFVPFLESTSNFKHFQKKDGGHS